MDRVKTTPFKWTSRHVLDALRQRHENDIWMEELRGGAGWSSDAQRYIDAFAMGSSPSKGNPRTAYEVKISKSDFARDLKKPLKQRPWRLYSNQFYYVAPEGIINPEKLPVWSGLIEVFHHPANHGYPEGFAVRVKVQAPWFDTEPATWRFVVSLIRHAQKKLVMTDVGE